MRKLLKIALSSILVLFLLPASLGAAPDAGTTQIVFPNGEIPYRDWMLPLNVQAQAVVKNFGDSAASFQVQLRIDTALVGTSQVTNLLPLDSALVQFPVTLPDSGTHSIACSTALTGDVQPTNDRIVASFETFEARLSVSFVSPGSRAQVGEMIAPLLIVRNRGFRAEGSAFLLTISRLADSMVVYQDAESAYILPTQSALVVFDSLWVPDSVGVYRLLLRIGRMPPPLLDTLSQFVTVVAAGVEEGETPSQLEACSLQPTATVVRGVLELPPGKPGQPTTGQSLVFLLDATGRRVAVLHAGPNEVSRLAPGVYFIRSGPSAVSREPSAVCKVVLAR